jgi:hypothetical protein
VHKTYLGDSVYADFDGFGIELTTNNGLGASNTIYLEPQVLDALEKYKEYLRKLNAQESSEPK